MDLNTDNWQKEAPTLAAMQRKNPFIVPAGYFEELSERLISRFRISYLNTNTEFGVPEGYFDQLEDHVNAKVFIENIRKQGGASGFTTPLNYFENLQARIAYKIADQQEPKKIRKLIPAWMNYAAAACLTFVVGSVIVFSLQHNTDTKEISSIPEQEIINYLQMHTDVGDNPVIIENLGKTADLSQINNEISAEELEYYLNNNNLQ